MGFDLQYWFFLVVSSKIIKQKIIKSNKNYQERIHIDSEFNSYFDLVKKLNTKYCFVIGTRLHMCILSLINGTPAFNISYEVKGKECYEYLGYNSYSADFNEDISIALSKFEDCPLKIKGLPGGMLLKLSEICLLFSISVLHMEKNALCMMTREFDISP